MITVDKFLNYRANERSYALTNLPHKRFDSKSNILAETSFLELPKLLEFRGNSEDIMEVRGCYYNE